MSRLIAVILVLVGLVAQSVCRHYVTSGVVVYAAPHDHGCSLQDEHHGGHDPHHSIADLLDSGHEHHSEAPCHFHVCRIDPAAPNHRAQVQAPKVVPVPVAVFDGHLRVDPRLIPSNPGGRTQWRAGPPPSIRTTRLLI